MTDYLLIRRRVINIYYVLITWWAIVGRILVFQVLAEEKLQAIHITANSPAHDRSQHRENDEAENILSAIFFLLFFSDFSQKPPRSLVPSGCEVGFATKEHLHEFSN